MEIPKRLKSGSALIEICSDDIWLFILSAQVVFVNK